MGELCKNSLILVASCGPNVQVGFPPHGTFWYSYRLTAAPVINERNSVCNTVKFLELLIGAAKNSDWSDGKFVIDANHGPIHGPIHLLETAFYAVRLELRRRKLALPVSRDAAG